MIDDPRGLPIPSDFEARIAAFARDMAYGALVNDWTATFQFNVSPRNEAEYGFSGQAEIKYANYRSKWRRAGIDVPHVSLLEAWEYVRSAGDKTYQLTPQAFALLKSKPAEIIEPRAQTDLRVQTGALRAIQTEAPAPPPADSTASAPQPTTAPPVPAVPPTTASTPLLAAGAPVDTPAAPAMIEPAVSNGKEPNAPAIAVDDRPTLPMKPKETPPPTVFIAYATEESGLLALLIEARLKLAGIPNPVVDKNLHAGESWLEQLEKWIRQCKYLVCVVAPKALDSGTLQKQLQWAHEAGVTVVSLWHGTARVPLKTGMLNAKAGKQNYAPDFVTGKLQLTDGYDILKKGVVITMDGTEASDYEYAITRLLNTLGYQTY